MYRIFSEGSKVKVSIPDKALLTEGADVVKKYQGRTFIVTRCRKYKTSGYMYTLAGAKSKFGIDYWFVDEWLESAENS